MASERLGQTLFRPDYSRAEKSYRAASMQRDDLVAGIIAALVRLERISGSHQDWEAAEEHRRAIDDLRSALDYSEARR